jgi:hypothetical protein
MSACTSLRWRLAWAICEDGFSGEPETAGDIERFIDSMSRRDRAVLNGVVQRISEIEATKGAQAAEAAASQVLEIVSAGRLKS